MPLSKSGLGGRVDATIVFIPRLSAMTPIDYDHAEFLGRDLAGIAREKAGIIKTGRRIFHRSAARRGR